MPAVCRLAAQGSCCLQGMGLQQQPPLQPLQLQDTTLCSNHCSSGRRAPSKCTTSSSASSLLQLTLTTGSRVCWPQGLLRRLRKHVLACYGSKCRGHSSSKTDGRCHHHNIGAACLAHTASSCQAQNPASPAPACLAHPAESYLHMHHTWTRPSGQHHYRRLDRTAALATLQSLALPRASRSPLPTHLPLNCQCQATPHQPSCSVRTARSPLSH